MSDLFYFKKFSLSDKDCGMKICTDAVLLGSWTDIKNSTSILDIGTGSGILALMLAQKTNAIIDAIEIDEMAFKTAESNFLNSPWNKRLHICNASLSDFTKTVTKTYDLIVCNPPFFQNSKLTNNHLKNIAKHNISMTYHELVASSLKLLNPDGKLSVILPFVQMDSFSEICVLCGFKSLRITEVIPVIGKSPNRVLMQWVLTTEKINCFKDQLIIRQNIKNYSTDYLKLTKDYLLKSF